MSAPPGERLEPQNTGFPEVTSIYNTASQPGAASGGEEGKPGDKYTTRREEITTVLPTGRGILQHCAATSGTRSPSSGQSVLLRQSLYQSSTATVQKPAAAQHHPKCGITSTNQTVNCTMGDTSVSETL